MTYNLALPLKFLQIVFVFTVLFLISCNVSKKNNASVEAAMKHYDNLILKLDADSIAILFTPDGNLGDIATGRDSIRKFLSSFKNIEVLSQASVTQSINITGDTAVQKGTYTQADVINQKDTVQVMGEFNATWQWLKKEGWHIKRITTKPTK